MALPTEDTNGPPKAKKLRQTSIISAFSSRGSVFTRKTRRLSNRIE